MKPLNKGFSFCLDGLCFIAPSLIISVTTILGLSWAETNVSTISNSKVLKKCFPFIVFELVSIIWC